MRPSSVSHRIKSSRSRSPVTRNWAPASMARLRYGSSSGSLGSSNRFGTARKRVPFNRSNSINRSTLSSVRSGKLWRRLERERTSFNSVRTSGLMASAIRPCSKRSIQVTAGPDSLIRPWRKTTQSKTTSGSRTALFSDFAYRRLDYSIQFFFRQVAGLYLFTDIGEQFAQ